MRGAVTRRAWLAGLALSLGLPGLLPGCSETAGEPIEVPVYVQGVNREGGSPARFTNAAGWAIELDAAWMALGPVYFEESTLPTTDGYNRTAWWRHLSLIGVAHAHVLATAGKAVGEVLHQTVIDLLADEPQVLGMARGETGDCRVFEVQLRPPGRVRVENPDALPRLAGANVRLTGRATKDGQTIAFTGTVVLDPDDLELQRVTDIRLDTPVPFVAAGGPLLRIQVANWLHTADFATLPENGDAPREITPDTSIHTAWLRAVVHRQTYHLEWLP